MKMVVVLVAIVFTDSSASFEIREVGFDTYSDCEKRLLEIADPWLVCGETSAQYLIEIGRR